MNDFITNDALNFLYEKLKEAILNPILLSYRLKTIGKTWRGMRPLDKVLSSGHPILIIHWEKENNTDEESYAYRGNNQFLITFYGYFDDSEDEDILTKYYDIIKQELINIQYPNKTLKSFSIIQGESLKSEMIGDKWFMGFEITCEIILYNKSKEV